MTTHNRTYLLSLAVAISLVAVPALAQDGKDDQNKVTGSVTVGAQTGNGIDQSSKLQQYETVPKGVTLFDANLDWQSGKRFITFSGNKLGLDDQFASFQAGQTSAWQLSMSLNQNPRWFSNKAETLYTQSSPGVFRLPDGMRAALQRIWSPYTAGGEVAAPANSSDDRFWSLRDYMSGAQPVDLRYVRKVGNVGLDLTAIENWTFKASYQREIRNGSQPVAFTAGPGIDEIANPIQYTTQDTRFEAEFAKSKFFANGAFTYSQFTNDVLYTTVDNPVLLNNTNYWWTGTPATVTNGNATARLWNAPSNKAASYDLTAGYQMPSNHKLTLTFSNTSMTNDQNFIPVATNPALNLATTDVNFGKFSLTPEYAAFNGKFDQTLFMGNFSGDPSPMFGYSAFYRSFDLKDKTPTYTFHSTSNSDGGASYNVAGLTPGDAGFKTQQFKLEAHVTPFTGFKLGVNGGQTKATFEDRDWLDVKDNTFGVSVDANLNFGMFHGGYSVVNRTPSSPNPNAVPEGQTGGPLDVNAEFKDQAKQDSKLYNATLTLTPMDGTALAIFVSGIDSKFPETSIGLKATNVKNYGVDYTFALTDKFSLTAGYIYEKLTQNNNFWYGANGTVAQPSATNLIDQYFNAIGDRVDTYKAGFRWNASAKVEIGSDFDYSKGRSDSGFSINPGGQAGGDMLFPTNTTTVNFTQMQYLNMPQVFNKTTIWKTWFSYNVDKNVTLSIMYWRQKFDQADYAYDGLAPYMLNGSSLYASTPGAVANLYPLLDASANRALFLGAVVPNYNANIVRVSLNCKF